MNKFSVGDLVALTDSNSNYSDSYGIGPHEITTINNKPFYYTIANIPAVFVDSELTSYLKPITYTFKL